MNSSTSSSDAARGFLRSFCGWSAVGCLLVGGALLVLDPYDTGRLTPLSRPGVPETAPRTASASRVRDPAFDAAIIGNSTIQLVSPERLKSLTGRDFVQLSVPATGPMEQAALAERLFAIRGRGIATLVLGLDGTWCDAARETSPVQPFPFWLHAASSMTYASGLFRMSSLEFLPGRVLVMLGSKRPARRDGYWDFEVLKPPARPDAAALPSMIASPVARTGAATGALARIASAAPPDTRIVLVHPPVHVSAARKPDDVERQRIDACKNALRSAIASRPGVAVLDFRIEDGSTLDPALFFDATHYRRPLAERIEAGIADALSKPR